MPLVNYRRNRQGSRVTADVAAIARTGLRPQGRRLSDGDIAGVYGERITGTARVWVRYGAASDKGGTPYPMRDSFMPLDFCLTSPTRFEQRLVLPVPTPVGYSTTFDATLPYGDWVFTQYWTSRTVVAGYREDMISLGYYYQYFIAHCKTNISYRVECLTNPIPQKPFINNDRVLSLSPQATWNDRIATRPALEFVPEGYEFFVGALQAVGNAVVAPDFFENLNRAGFELMELSYVSAGSVGNELPQSCRFGHTGGIPPDSSPSSPLFQEAVDTLKFYAIYDGEALELPLTDVPGDTIPNAEITANPRNQNQFFAWLRFPEGTVKFTVSKKLNIVDSEVTEEATVPEGEFASELPDSPQNGYRLFRVGTTTVRSKVPTLTGDQLNVVYYALR